MLYTLCVSWFRNTHSHLGSHWNALQTCAGWDATFSFPFSTCCRNTQAVVSHLGPDTQKNISSCGVSGYQPSTSIFFYPSSSIISLSAAPGWASRGVLLRPCEELHQLFMSCSLATRTEVPESAWPSAVMYCCDKKKKKKENLFCWQPRSSSCSSAPTTVWHLHTVAQEVTVLFSCTMFQRGFRPIQANNITAASEGGCDDWLLGFTGSWLLPGCKGPFGRICSLTWVTSLFPCSGSQCAPSPWWHRGG